MPKRIAEIGVTTEKMLDAEDVQIIQFLESNPEMAYTEEDLKKELNIRDIYKPSFAVHLKILLFNKKIESQKEKDLSGKEVVYYMAKRPEILF